MLGLEHVPDGMTIADYRDHPVRRMLIFAGGDGKRALPTRAEVESLGLDPAARKQLEAACMRVAKLRDDPDRDTSAMAEANRVAGEIVGSLPDHQRDPRWFGRPDDDELSLLSPAELAARVPREWQ